MYCIQFQRTSTFLFVCFCSFYREVTSHLTNMKIVDEPSTYGLNNIGGNIYDAVANSLKLRIKPANFSGPAHFKRLEGRCFTKIFDSYKYEFCPYSNVTQHEQSMRWNPYSGVLGVWQEWEIQNNTFVAMVMRDGDNCGEKFRSVKVYFVCGNQSSIINVTEPYMCEYHVTFQTVLVCHPNAMLVYPVLDQQYQDRWDEIETMLSNKELSQKGYKKKLDRLFEEVGFYLSSDKRQLLSNLKEEKKEIDEKDTKLGKFSSLENCTKEFEKLEKEIIRLKQILSNNGIKDTDDSDVQNSTVAEPNHNSTAPNRFSNDSVHLP